MIQKPTKTPAAPPTISQMINNHQTNLKLILADYIGYVNEDFGKILSYDERMLMAATLQQFLIKAVDKYFKGQKEHGGSITNRDLQAEIQHEIIDLMWYNAAVGWKNKTKNTDAPSSGS